MQILKDTLFANVVKKTAFLNNFYTNLAPFPFFENTIRKEKMSNAKKNVHDPEPEKTHIPGRRCKKTPVVYILESNVDINNNRIKSPDLNRL